MHRLARALGFAFTNQQITRYIAHDSDEIWNGLQYKI